VQVADIRLALHDVFAVKLEQQAKHTVSGRVLRSHVEDHAMRAGFGRFFRDGGYRDSGNGLIAHN
jgi:hypothetical protein